MADLPDMPLGGVADLTRLVPCSEEAVFESLRRRFQSKQPFSRAGSVLVALNLERDLAEVWGDSAMAQHPLRRPAKGAKLAPHLYEVSADAYRALVNGDKNQCILLLGESGSGKTESAKHLVKHLVYLAKDRSMGSAALGASSGGSLRTHILSPQAEAVVRGMSILESFGNANTSLNPNASRFCGVTSLHYGSGGVLIGGSVDVALPQFSGALGSQEEGAFHVLYQLAAAPEGLKHRLGLGGFSSSELRYLKGRSDKIDEQQASKGFSSTTEALSLLGVDPEAVWKLVAAVLLLGEVTFDEGISGPQSCAVSPECDLASLAKLLGTTASDLNKHLTQSATKGKLRTVKKTLSVDAAVATCNHLATFIYTRLFRWLVSAVNQSIRPVQESSRFISIVDTLGYENLSENHMQQLCSNFASEKFHQFLLESCIKEPEATLVSDGVKVSAPHFVDNAGILSALESPTSGLITLLTSTSSPAFAAEASAQSGGLLQTKGDDEFVVKHTSGTVIYNCCQWQDADCDYLRDDMQALLDSTSGSFLVQVLRTTHASETGAKSKASARGCHRFRSDVQRIIDSARKQADMKFVVCLRATDSKAPTSFNGRSVLHQLRSHEIPAICEAMSSSSYLHTSHSAFVEQYTVLLPSKAVAEMTKLSVKAQSGVLVRALNCKGSVVGSRNVHLLAEHSDKLETWLSARLNIAAQRITETVSTVSLRRKFLRQRAAAIKIQSIARMLYAWIQVDALWDENGYWPDEEEEDAEQAMLEEIIMEAAMAEAFGGLDVAEPAESCDDDITFVGKSSDLLGAYKQGSGKPVHEEDLTDGPSTGEPSDSGDESQRLMGARGAGLAIGAGAGAGILAYSASVGSPTSSNGQARPILPTMRSESIRGVAFDDSVKEKSPKARLQGKKRAKDEDDASVGARVGFIDTDSPDEGASEAQITPRTMRKNNFNVFDRLSAMTAIDRDARMFVMTPISQTWGTIKCRVFRDKSSWKGGDSFRMYAEGDAQIESRFVMSARKRTQLIGGSNYQFSVYEGNYDTDGIGYVGKLKPKSRACNTFQLFDAGVQAREGLDARSELACVYYPPVSDASNPDGPKQMKIALGYSSLNQRKRTPLLDHIKGETLIVDDETQVLRSRTARWSQKEQAYILNFNGRVKLASVKNFQLCLADDPNELIRLQFGRVGQDEFTMDFAYPLTPLQAFAISLSSFDSK